jgi:hypothetical protein
LKPDPIYRASSVLDTHGKAVAEHVASFEARHVGAIKHLVQRERIDCDFEETKVHDVCFYDAGRAQTKATLAKLVEASISTANEIQYRSGAEAEEVCTLGSRAICGLNKRKLTIDTGIWCQRGSVLLDIQRGPTVAVQAGSTSARRSGITGSTLANVYARHWCVASGRRREGLPLVRSNTTRCCENQSRHLCN